MKTPTNPRAERQASTEANPSTISRDLTGGGGAAERPVVLSRVLSDRDSTTMWGVHAAASAYGVGPATAAGRSTDDDEPRKVVRREPRCCRCEGPGGSG